MVSEMSDNFNIWGNVYKYNPKLYNNKTAFNAKEENPHLITVNIYKHGFIIHDFSTKNKSDEELGDLIEKEDMEELTKDEKQTQPPEKKMASCKKDENKK